MITPQRKEYLQAPFASGASFTPIHPLVCILTTNKLLTKLPIIHGVTQAVLSLLCGQGCSSARPLNSTLAPAHHARLHPKVSPLVPCLTVSPGLT